ncbi:MAG: undecaprenyl-phosphate glucose phosphotransferase [Deltaproteobacteria bacterium]|nr:MAG: undecaprenyl-phosphate glucose phosphotransferase [Deltaproteobacteria bacterium]
MTILNRSTFSTFQKVVDTLSCLIFFFLAYVIRFEYLEGGQQGIEWTFIQMAPVLVFSTLYSFHKNGLYRPQRFTSKYYEILSVMRGNIAGIIGFVIVLYFFGEERLSRLTILIYGAVSTLGFIIIRLLVRNFLRTIREKGYNLRHVLLIGNSNQLVEYVHTARHFKDSGIRFLGWIDSQGIAKEHDVPEIEISYDEYKKSNTPDAIVMSYAGVDSAKSQDFIKTHYNDVVPIQILPDLSYSMVGHQVEDFGGIPILGVNQPSLNPIELFLKRVFEFTATLIGLLIISPLMLLISIAVKLSSPGPIFYGQERVGHDGRTFKMWKFRSMKMADDDTDKKEWSNKENPRKTKVGDFLRRTSLDELPQLWNVLVGDMSLVGPRPEQPYFVEKFRHEIPGYMLKHKMKPGITGWAQVNGWRGDTSLHKRIECDIYYIKHWSFWFDIKILFLTFFKGFINKNAY